MWNRSNHRGADRHDEDVIDFRSTSGVIRTRNCTRISFRKRSFRSVSQIIQCKFFNYSREYLTSPARYRFGKSTKNGSSSRIVTLRTTLTDEQRWRSYSSQQRNICAETQFKDANTICTVPKVTKHMFQTLE